MATFIQSLKAVTALGLIFASTGAHAFYIGAEAFTYKYKYTHRNAVVVNGFLGPFVRVTDVMTSQGNLLSTRFLAGHDFIEADKLSIGAELGLIGQTSKRPSSEAMAGIDFMAVGRYAITDEFHGLAKFGVSYNEFIYRVRVQSDDNNRLVSFTGSTPEIRVGAEYKPTHNLGISASVHKALKPLDYNSSVSTIHLDNQAGYRLGVSWYFN